MEAQHQVWQSGGVGEQGHEGRGYGHSCTGPVLGRWGGGRGSTGHLLHSTSREVEVDVPAVQQLLGEAEQGGVAPAYSGGGRGGVAPDPGDSELC